jgi:hypothetical protein
MSDHEKVFFDYCWSFYGPHQIYGNFFGHQLQVNELRQAIEIRKVFALPVFQGDSIDRELVRDILIAMRGAK